MNVEDLASSYDVLIVGAGSAGCALAARLAEDPDRRVLLVEAGMDYGYLAAYPMPLQRSYNMSASLPGDPHGWSYSGQLTPDVSYPVTRGRVVGGSSAVNGGQFTRGIPSDYDEWAAQGNSEWSFANVLPFFVRMENDLDFGASEWHGDSGPIPVRRPADMELTPVARAFVDACLSTNHPWDPDMNSPDSQGVGLLPHNVINGARQNMAVTYVPPDRRPPNLELLDQLLVTRVIVEGSAAQGVEGVRDGKPVTIKAKEVVISAGGLNSPHLLMLSGIGAASDLSRLGIPVVLDLPGVGKSFMDHPSVVVTYRLHSDAPPGDDQPSAQVCLNYTAGSTAFSNDMRMFPFSMTKAQMLMGKKGDRFTQRLRFLKHSLATARALAGTSRHALVEDVRHRADLGIYCGVEVEESRGEVVPVSADPFVLPKVEYRYLTQESDRQRLREAVRLAYGFLCHRAFKELGVEITGPTNQDLRSDAELDRWIMSNVRTSSHTSGTCKMGPESQLSSVVDQRCRVIGIDHLRVIDASVMPTLVRRGTNATAAMIGERASEFFGIPS